MMYQSAYTVSLVYVCLVRLNQCLNNYKYINAVTQFRPQSGCTTSKGTKRRRDEVKTTPNKTKHFIITNVRAEEDYNTGTALEWSIKNRLSADSLSETQSHLEAKIIYFPVLHFIIRKVRFIQ